MTVISEWIQRVSLRTMNSTILGESKRNFSSFNTSTAFCTEILWTLKNKTKKCHLVNSFETRPREIFKELQDFIGFVIMCSPVVVLRALVSGTGAEGGEGGHRHDDVQDVVGGHLDRKVNVMNNWW